MAQMKMAENLDAIAKADLSAHAVAEQIASPKNASLSAQLAPFSDALKAVLTGNPAKHEPGIDEVNGGAGQLYGELEQADGVPTQALLIASAQAQASVKQVLAAWADFREKQLPELNKVLEAAHHARIDLKKAPGDIPDDGDED